MSIWQQAEEKHGLRELSHLNSCGVCGYQGDVEFVQTMQEPLCKVCLQFYYRKQFTIYVAPNAARSPRSFHPFPRAIACRVLSFGKTVKSKNSRHGFPVLMTLAYASRVRFAHNVCVPALVSMRQEYPASILGNVRPAVLPSEPTSSMNTNVEKCVTRCCNCRKFLPPRKTSGGLPDCLSVNFDRGKNTVIKTIVRKRESIADVIAKRVKHGEPSETAERATHGVGEIALNVELRNGTLGKGN